MKPKALYILGNQELIYGPQEQAEIEQLVDLVGPTQGSNVLTTAPELLADVEIILSGWGAPRLDDAFLQAAPNLKIFLYGAGSVRGFVTEAFWARDIVITSSWAANAIPVSEYTLSTILLSLKRFWAYSSQVRALKSFPEGSTKHSRTPGAFGTTVGLISLGMIGRLVCERLRPFDLRVIAYDPFVDPDVAAQLGVELVSLPQVFERSDVVSLHTPWLPETEGMITGTLLRSMKPDSTFINTARGAIVREDELIAALRDRPDLWAILDVTYPEPPRADSALFTLPNILVTPHIAGSQAAECRRMGQYVIADLRRYLAGEPLKWALTQEQARVMA